MISPTSVLPDAVDSVNSEFDCVAPPSVSLSKVVEEAIESMTFISESACDSPEAEKLECVGGSAKGDTSKESEGVVSCEGSLFITVIVGIEALAFIDKAASPLEDTGAPVTGTPAAEAEAAVRGSGVTDRDGCWLEVADPKTAAAVDVDVSAALKVLKAGGPAVLARQAAWFSSLLGTFATGCTTGGGGVRLRERDQDLRPGERESWELTFACVGCCDEVDRFIEEPDEEGIEEPAIDNWVSSAEGPGPGDGVALVEDSAVLWPVSPLARPAAASCFFFSSASLRCCSSWSINDNLMASMSINYKRGKRDEFRNHSCD